MIPPVIEDGDGWPLIDNRSEPGAWADAMFWRELMKDAASSGPDGHKLARPVLSPFHSPASTDERSNDRV